MGSKGSGLVPGIHSPAAGALEPQASLALHSYHSLMIPSLTGVAPPSTRHLDGGDLRQDIQEFSPTLGVKTPHFDDLIICIQSLVAPTPVFCLGLRS